jgi:hypothetical protein
VPITVKNCISSGTLTSAADKKAAFVGYYQSCATKPIQVSNSYTTIEGVNLYTSSFSAATATNSYKQAELADNAAAVAAIDKAVYAPDITSLEIRLKLTDDFGFMASDVMYAGADEAGFVFSTEAITDANVASLAKTKGASNKGATYATYTALKAAELDTTIYFAAYVTVDGETYYSAARSINCKALAEDLVDGYYGDAETGVLVTENEAEKNLYAAIVTYYEKYSAYLDSVTPA